jgi:hypothetical protein
MIKFNEPTLDGNIYTKNSFNIEDINALKLNGTILDYEIDDIGIKIVKILNKDEVVAFSYNKVFNDKFKLRNVFKKTNNDHYYSGFLDCFEWIENYSK